ncbi:MAG: glycosyltransferase family 4 protein [Chitinispirillaceae bacterium]|nr:glycosyltransferase family 4 protein [Chitinispirillaceae bacterium]
MKILFTLDFPPEKGGIQRYLHDIVRHTFSEDDLVITGRGERNSDKNDRQYPCRILRLAFPGEMINKKILLLPMFLRMVRYGNGNNDCRILAGNVYAAMVPWLLSIFTIVKYRVFCYGTELLPIRNGSLRTMLWKAVLGRAERVYYLTGATQRLLEIAYSCTWCEQWVPKIDLPAFVLENKKWNRNRVELLSVGRLVPHKGHAILIEAAARLTDQPEWHLTIIGSGSEEQYLVERVGKLSLASRVEIRTAVSDEELTALYEDADILILPSIATPSAMEGFGIVLLEAMAYGAAIIASRSGGIEEVLAGCVECAELVPPGNGPALSEVIQDLIGDEKKRCRMAHAARDYLERRYVW